MTQNFIVNANNCLNGVFSSFDPFHKELSSGFRLVDNFPNHFSFHTVNHKGKESKKVYFCKLDKIFKDTSCHMQVHPSKNYILTIISPPNYTSPPSIVATFLATCLMVVLQPSRYSIFHSRDTLI